MYIMENNNEPYYFYEILIMTYNCEYHLIIENKSYGYAVQYLNVKSVTKWITIDFIVQ